MATYTHDASTMAGFGGPESSAWSSDGSVITKTTDPWATLVYQTALVGPDMSVRIDFLADQYTVREHYVLARLASASATINTTCYVLGVSDQPNSTATLNLYRGNGDGTFTLLTTFPSTANATAAVALQCTNVSGNVLIEAFQFDYITNLDTSLGTYTDSSGSKTLTGNYCGVSGYLTATFTQFSVTEIGAAPTTATASAQQAVATGAASNATVTTPGFVYAAALMAAAAGVADNAAVTSTDALIVPDVRPEVVENPAFTVQREPYSDITGGDSLRDGMALRYAIVVPASQQIAAQSSLVSFVASYTSIELTWGYPRKFTAWTEMSVVRSGFGHPSTVNDGVTIYRVDRADFAHVDADGTPLAIKIIDTDLQPGRWYYYTLFFSTTAAEWVPVLRTEALLPRNHGHADHLWNAVPPYYQWVDGRYRGNEGHLRQFLNVFGFELDLQREYIESWQEAYHADFSPVTLLKRVGENLGLPYEAGLGEIRYRALVGQLSELYDSRGTPEGIRRLIEVGSKYECDLTVGRNLLLLPDDSEFATGPGNWVVGGGGVATTILASTAISAGVANNATVTNNAWRIEAGTAVATGLANDTGVRFSGVGVQGTRTAGTGVATGAAFNATVTYPIVITAPYITSDRSPGYGRGVLQVSVPVEVGTGDVVIQAGIGTLSYQGITKALSPKFNSVPVDEGFLYGFSVQYKGRVAGTAGIYWFDRNERPISKDEFTTILPGAWQAITVQASPPVGAVYAVPYVRQTGRAAGDGWLMMGAMFYKVGSSSTVAALAPDYYLTLNFVGELIGEGAGTSRVMGDPN